MIYPPFTPPREIPSVLVKLKGVYCYWLALHKNFPKVERFGLGQKIDKLFLDVLEFTLSSTYLPPEQKVSLLARAIARLDTIKFFTQLAWENKLIATEKYAELLTGLEEVGRMLGGWRKGLQNKTPTPTVR